MSLNTYDPVSKKLIQIAGNEEAKAVKLEDLPNVDTNNLSSGDVLVYNYDEEKWENKNLEIKKSFFGTTAEWNDLTPAEQAEYESKDIIDDYNGVDIDASPTENSSNLVSSGGTYEAIQETLKGDCVIIAASYGVTPSASVNFISKLKPLLTTTYENVFNNSLGGAGFYNGQYLSLIHGLDSTITRKERIKTILVVGIGNDISYTWSDVLSAMITFRTYCNNNYPNAQVIIVPVSVRTAKTEVDNLFTLYRNMRMSIVSHRMGIMENAYHILALNYKDLVSSDGVHPTELGAQRIAEAIYNNICGGKFDYEFNYVSDALTDCDNPKTNVTVNISRVAKSISGVHITSHQVFTVTENVAVSPNWGYQFPLWRLKEIKRPQFFIDESYFGVLWDNTDNTMQMVRVGIEYDSTLGDYYVGFIANNGQFNLQTGHSYRFRTVFDMPFIEA